ncbi:heterocycloanthracin/sonorensin family bacteriocin [Peribacillus asahii]|uniref:Heterocycloanthracin/sonorensin family bacteriocin n=1 Tax=Peribacillus asahii TaxID=228899 RepID=A0A398BAR7_9BACI|nr:heterocycloanthracin/sonorensin family bacteriocin [Peribacillus asahii]RID86654.1 heterocycloanthracin/sonorensin family bacteriocin [Peribacillus asahii]
MHNFQNELQTLGMDNYQVGQVTPIDYQYQNPVEFVDMRRCGGCGFRCGGCGFRCGGFRCGGCFGIGFGFGCFGCFGFFI